MEKIIENLSWNSTKVIQEKTIQEIINNNKFRYELLLQPFGRKDCWENCALVFYMLSDEVINQYIPSLLEWLQDANWPGASTIFRRLNMMPIDIIMPHLSGAMSKSLSSKDEEWYENLLTLESSLKMI